MESSPNICIVNVPYDSGHYEWRMGGGPGYLLKNGLTEALESAEQEVRLETLHPEGDTLVEVATAFELDRIVSRKVRAVLDAGEFPLVLSGNCNTSVGTISGANSEKLGVVWLDGHADFNTPETTINGFSDGMGLAIAVGHCWSAMADSVPGFSPVDEENVVLAGIKDIETSEQLRLAASRVTVIGAELIEREGLGTLAKALDELRTRVSRVYVHLDLDVLSPAKVGRANEFAPKDGLSVEELEMVFGLVRERFTVVAGGIASYDPTFDIDRRVLRAAIAGSRTLISRS